MLVIATGVYASEWPDFQTQGTGPGSDHQMIGGLGFTVLLNPPRLWKIPVITASSQYWDAGHAIAPGPRLPMDLGMISCGEPPEVKELARDWSHVGLQLSPRLTLQVTRVSPALVFDCAARELTLFAGGRTTPVGYATAHGVFSMSQPLTKGLAGQCWMLLWFGAGAGLQSTRHPWTRREDFGGQHLINSIVDCPMLLLFANPPETMTARDGVTFATNDQRALGKVVLLPLYGDVYPLASETAAWSNTPDGKAGATMLPDAVMRACQWWADHLAEVPVTAREQYLYDQRHDTVTIDSAISYVKVRPGGIRLAPLPPLLSIAREQGFPLKLSGAPVRSSVITALGPYAGIEGVDHYQCRVSGLGKYVQQSPVPVASVGEPRELNELLKQEIAKITQAGHLRPWLPCCDSLRANDLIQIYGQSIMVYSTPETLSMLCEALPFLSPAQQQDVKTYLKRERRDYPPEFVAVSPLDVGGHRERSRNAIDDDIFDQDQYHHNVLQYCGFHVSHHFIPPDTLYALSEYARTVEPMSRRQAQNAIRQVLPPYFLHQDWADMGDLFYSGSYWGAWYGQGGELDANTMFNGLVGALRLATQTGDRESLPVLWGQFALTSMRRYALGHYADFLYQDRILLLPTDPTLTKEQWAAYCCGPTDAPGHQRLLDEYARPDWQVQHLIGACTGCLQTYQWTTPRDDVRAVIRMNEYGVMFNDTPFYYNGNVPGRFSGVATPELARFLAEGEPDQARRFLDRFVENVPSWYLAYASTHVGSEMNYQHPRVAHDQFLLRAWVLKEHPDQLARYLDVPWVERGDLYYIQKLVATIAAYRGTTWRAGADQPGKLISSKDSENQVSPIWPIPALGNENMPVIIPSAPDTFKIDGDFAKWAAIQALPAPFAKKDAGLLKLAWTHAGLFGYLHAPDSNISVNASQPWSGDGLEIWLETDFARATSMHDHACQLAVAPNPTGGGAGIVAKASGVIDTAQVSTQWRKATDGYMLEFFFPAASLAPAKLMSGTKIGFNYSVDDKGKSIEEFYSDKGVANGYCTPMTWGVIQLGEKDNAGK